MNKVKFSAILLTICLTVSIFAINSANAQAVPGVSVSTNKKAYSPGESGVLIINFKTGAQVKIPKDPGITINLTSSEIEGQGVQDYSGGDGDYINNSKVKYNFTIPNGASSGSTLAISGNVKFGYCSTKDGICKLTTKNFSTKVKVK